MKKIVKKDINLKQTLAQALELPKEIILNLPLITIIGTQQLSIENCNGIVEYTSEQIRLNTSCGMLKIQGNNLFIKEITSENIEINGKVHLVQYIV